MKKLIVSIVIFGFAGTAYAQNGVGIGTNNPQEKLDVDGAIKIGNTNTANAGTIRWNGTDFEGYDGSAWVVLSGGTASNNWTVSASDIYNANVGNVGVGVASPQQKLDVDGAIQLGTTTTATAGAIRWTGTAFEGYDGTQWVNLGVAADSDWTESGNDIYSANSGNVGIGTTSPTSKLEVAGSLAIGNGCTTGSSEAFAGGFNSTAAANSAIAFGTIAAANGGSSAALGQRVTANGNRSFATGFNTTAESRSEAVFGQYTTAYTPAGGTATWNTADRLFVIGNGSNNANRHNALTITKDGTMNINEAYDLPNAAGTTGQVLTVDGSGNAIWAAPVADGDGDATNELQTLSQTGTNVTLNNGGGTISVTDNDDDSSNEIQDLSSSSSGTNRTINIAGGTGTTISVADNDNDATNELQTMSISGSDLTLSNGGGTITLPADGDGDATNELQTLSQTGTNVTLSNGGGTISVADNDNDSSNEIQDLSSTSSGTNRTINIAGGTGTTISVADNDNDAANEIQALSISGSTVSLSNGGGSITLPAGADNLGNHAATTDLDMNTNKITDLGTPTAAADAATKAYVDAHTDADSDASNEIQNLSSSTSGTNRTINISSGTGTTISVADNDNDAANELQTMSISGSNLTLSNGGGTITLPADGDGDASNELQDLSSSSSGTNRTVNISGGTGTTISVADNDNDASNELQTLSISGSDISLSNGGGTVSIPATAFATTSNVTSNTPGNQNSDDFVFGSPQLADNGNTNHDRRMYFDKSSAAFRAGMVQGTQWNAANVGANSAAFGLNNEASGGNSMSSGVNNIASGSSAVANGSNTEATANSSSADGYYTNATGNYSKVWGDQGTASGARSTAWGRSTNATGTGSTAFGYQATASGNDAAAFGINTTASGYGSVAWGSGSNATNQISTAWGAATSSGVGSTAWGSVANASGNWSTASGVNVLAPSYSEMAVGTFNTSYAPSSTTNFVTSDRAFSVGVGTSAGNRKNGLTVFKNGTVNINEAYDMPNADGTSGQVLTTDGSGNAAWQAAPADGDGDSSNEIQDLSSTSSGTNRTVNISGGTGTTISVADNDNDSSNELQTMSQTGNSVTLSNGGGTISVADNDNDAANELQTLSLSGSDLSLSNGGGTISLPTDNDWTISGSDQYSGVSGNVGIGTTAPTAKLEVFGTFEAGSINTATGLWSSALGRQNNASGNYSTARGFDNTSSGEFSFASGRSSIASGQNNIAMGSWAESSGGSAIAIGQRVYARSGYETSLGRYNTDYTPNQQFGWDASDRLFSIGNGTSNAARSNALTIYKDGTMNINDAYDMPTADGTSGQVLTTDGSGTATWQDAGGTSPTATYGTAYLGVSSQTLTTTYTNYVSVTLPEAGTYRVFALATVRSTVSPAMVVMAFSSSATGLISNSEFQGHLVQTGGPKYTSSSNEIFVTVTGPTTISLQARYINGVGYLENGSAGRTKLTYMKIAD